VESNPCPHCGAPLRPAARFCLACDTPVEPAESSRLSIAEPEPAAPVRRLPILLAGVVAIAALAFLTVGVVHWVGRHETNAVDQAAGNAGRGLALVVDAESGRGGVCHRTWTAYVSGIGRDLRQECEALADRDPGARLEDVREDPARLGSTTGSVTVHATLADDHGTRAFTQKVDLVDVNGRWLMTWDGRPVA